MACWVCVCGVCEGHMAAAAKPCKPGFQKRLPSRLTANTGYNTRCQLRRGSSGPPGRGTAPQTGLVHCNGCISLPAHLLAGDAAPHLLCEGCARISQHLQGCVGHVPQQCGPALFRGCGQLLGGPHRVLWSTCTVEAAAAAQGGSRQHTYVCYAQGLQCMHMPYAQCAAVAAG